MCRWQRSHVFSELVFHTTCDDEALFYFQSKIARHQYLIQGQWIAVVQDEQWWPGEVLDVKYLNGVPNYEIKACQ